MRSFLTLIVIVAVALTAGPADAYVIVQVEPDGSMASAHAVLDYSSGTHVAVQIDKEFKDPAMVGSPLVLQFILEPADVGKDIWLTEQVLNNTQVAWVDYHFVLVNPPALPLPLAQPAGAVFVDLNGIDSPGGFGTPAAANSAQIDFLGGPIAHGQTVDFTGIRIGHSGADGDLFYLKQIPTPEPATAALIAIGAIGLLLRRRRK